MRKMEGRLGKGVVKKQNGCPIILSTSHCLDLPWKGKGRRKTLGRGNGDIIKMKPLLLCVDRVGRNTKVASMP